MIGLHARPEVLRTASVSRRTAASCAGRTAVKSRAQVETPTSTAFLDFARSATTADCQLRPYSNTPKSHIAIGSKASAASATKHSAYPETTVRSTGDLVSGLDSMLCASPKFWVSDSKRTPSLQRS